MTDLSTLANMAEILGAIVVIGGLVFAIIQMRSLRQQRREMAAIELFRSFGNANFNKAYETVLGLPEGLSRAELVSREPTANSCATLICTTMENIGVMTYQRIVPFQVVHNLMGTSAVLLWRRLEKWVVELRQDLGNPEAFDGHYDQSFLRAQLSAFQRSYAYVLAHGLDAVNADMQNFAHLKENFVAAATSHRYFA